MNVKKGTKNIMLEKTIGTINEQGKSLEKHSNRWNIMQQLIDIISVQPDCAEIVYQDLQIEEMTISKLVSKITNQRLADPVKVMQEICKFYSIPCPSELPPETWRNAISVTNTSKPSEPLSLLDLL